MLLAARHTDRSGCGQGPSWGESAPGAPMPAGLRGWLGSVAGRVEVCSCGSSRRSWYGAIGAGYGAGEGVVGVLCRGFCVPSGPRWAGSYLVGRWVWPCGSDNGGLSDSNRKTGRAPWST